MQLHRFLSLLAVCFGLVGSIFLAKSILFLSTKALLSLTSPYPRIAYAPEQIKSLAEQKAGALVGVLIIFLAFLTQLVALILLTNGTPFTKTQSMGLLLLFIIIIILIALSYFVDKKLQKHIKLKIGKIAVRDYCAARFTGSVDPVNVKGLETMSQELLNISRKYGETKANFIKRIAGYVNWQVPKEIDFSKIVNDDKSK